MKRFVAVVACGFLLAAAPKAPAPAPYPDAVTHHTIVLDGKTIAYTARAGTIGIRDEHEKLQATMFYTAFTADGADPARRPITFLYNGGPGSASLWLRMGSFGPVRVVTKGEPSGNAPFKLVDNNRESLLDVSDLVFVDITDSGFGRLQPGADPKQFFGCDQDVAAFGQFIERYLNQFGRWNSPKVLFGESYGAPRTAMLANYLEFNNIGVNGIVLQSSLLNESLASPFDAGGTGTDDWQYVFQLPTYAATAYHYRLVSDPPKTLPAFVAEATQFAMTDYREALAQGSNLPADRRASILHRLHRYTGLSEEYLSNSNLRVPWLRYGVELRRSQGLVQGIYDSQVALTTIDRGAEFPVIDPTNSQTGPPYFALHNAYVRNVLKYNPPMLYRAGAYTQIGNAGGWDFRHNGTLPMETAQDLAAALVANPSLRVFSANGYFDMVTPFTATVYTLNHLGLDPSIRKHVSFGFYESGHLLYSNEKALRKYHADLERWYRSTLR